MILIADSGSTKTDWCILDLTTVNRFATEGFNPYFTTTDKIAAALVKHFPSSISFSDIAEAHFYGSGCFPDKVQVIRDAIRSVCPNALVNVQLDLLGTARALLGNSEGFASILGTGTNTCLFDGQQISMNIDSLGYILGDEGSGTNIGKQLLADFLRGYMPKSVQYRFKEEYQLTIEEAFDWIYAKPNPNRYCASFVPFLNLPGIDEEYRGQVLDHSFDAFFTKLVTHYPGYTNYTFNCSGSIAWIFRQELTAVAARYHMMVGRIIQQPLDSLIAYHRDEQPRL